VEVAAINMGRVRLVWSRIWSVISGQGPTLVHFSAQPKPCLTQQHTLHTPQHPFTPPKQPLTLHTPKHPCTPPKQPLNAPPVPRKALTLSR